MEKVLIAIVFILFILLIISIVICYIKIDISTFNIKNTKIDKNIKIVFLSDLHNRNIHKKIIKIISEIKPDIIICGGDMVNGGYNRCNSFFKLINSLNEYKIYYTYGNHEEKICEKDDKEYEFFNKKVSRYGVILLNNDSIKLSNNIKLSGFNPDINFYGSFGKTCLNSEIISNNIGKLNTNNFNILISHNPLEFNSYVEFNADLVLCGHIHGGAIKIFKRGLLSPDITFFPKYFEGIYKKNNTSMIVSRGLGFSSKLPFRINNNPEVVVINLKNK